MFFLDFWNLNEILNILKKKMILIATWFWKLHTDKELFSHSLKNTISDIPLTINMWKSPKLLWNLHNNTFIIFSNDYGRPWFLKYLT